MVCPVSIRLSVPLQEIWHFQKSRDLTGIITKQKTSHRHKDAHDKGAHGKERDRSIDSIIVPFLLLDSRDGFSRWFTVSVEILRAFLERLLEHGGSEGM